MLKLGDVEDAIEALEWGSCDGCGLHHRCSVCEAPRMDWDADQNEIFGQHKPDCPVPALIAKLRADPLAMKQGSTGEVIQRSSERRMR